MSVKGLDGTGLARLIANIKANFALKSQVPTKVSDLTNDSGFLTSYTETDPTVPSWAKASSKPTYTASEVGAAASSHNHSASDINSGTLASARLPIATANDLGGIKVGSGLSISDGVLSSSGGDVPYGTCASGAREQYKTVALANFALKTGAVIAVKFTNSSSGSGTVPNSFYMNVNNTGDYIIRGYDESLYPSGYTTSWVSSGFLQNFYDLLSRGYIGLFMFTGDSWDFISNSVRRVKTLWSNSSPTSSFAAQTIYPGWGLTYCSFIIIYYNMWGTETYQPSGASYAYGTWDSTIAYMTRNGQLLAFNGQGNNRVGRRRFQVNTSSITFDDAYYNASKNNSYLIPAHVQGVWI